MSSWPYISIYADSNSSWSGASFIGVVRQESREKFVAEPECDKIMGNRVVSSLYSRHRGNKAALHCIALIRFPPTSSKTSLHPVNGPSPRQAHPFGLPAGGLLRSTYYACMHLWNCPALGDDCQSEILCSIGKLLCVFL